LSGRHLERVTLCTGLWRQAQPVLGPARVAVELLRVHTAILDEPASYVQPILPYCKSSPQRKQRRKYLAGWDVFKFGDIHVRCNLCKRPTNLWCGENY